MDGGSVTVLGAGIIGTTAAFRSVPFSLFHRDTICILSEKTAIFFILYNTMVFRVVVFPNKINQEGLCYTKSSSTIVLKFTWLRLSAGLSKATIYSNNHGSRGHQVRRQPCKLWNLDIFYILPNIMVKNTQSKVRYNWV